MVSGVYSEGMKTFLVALSMLAVASVSGAQNPVKWSLQGPRSLTVQPRAVISLQVTAQIENGWRVYSLTQPKGGPYGMTITLLPGSRATFGGAVRAPAPVAKYDSSFKMMAETYSGKAVFTIPLRAPGEEGTTSSTLKIRYQACNARFCLPPRNELIQLTLKVKSGA